MSVLLEMSETQKHSVSIIFYVLTIYYIEYETIFYDMIFKNSTRIRIFLYL